MFSALKKLTSKQDQGEKRSLGPGMGPMSDSLQKKFSRGVNYNMKIIIRGDRNVGKSCLFKRLQGGSFLESYVPTEEIQVASIQWSFKATEDIVKVEVWDVVDKGKARNKLTGLKLNEIKMPEIPALDADFMDVYKGTHGVILMMDITKSWTFEYVEKELTKIPPDIPTLVLGNHCDMAHHRCISVGQAQSLIELISANRQAEIIYAESSMRNGFGLRLLHKFLGLPFLRLQKESYLALIERNKRDSYICSIEINEFLKSEDADYSNFLNILSDKRRQVADSQSKTTLNSLNYNKNMELCATKSIVVGRGKPIIIPGIVNTSQNFKEMTHTSSIESTSNESIPAENILCNDKLKNNISLNNNSVKKIECLEEFCPDEGILDKNFLEDVITPNNYQEFTTTANDSDSDLENNPMVARFDDEPISGLNSPISKSKRNSVEIDTNDQQHIIKINPLAKNNKKIGNSKNNSSDKFSLSDEILSNAINTTLDLTKIDTGDISDFWTPDMSVRRSPEGGEDDVQVPNLNLDHELSEKDETVRHKKKKDKKSKDSESSKKDRKKKKKKRHSQDENDFENFLNNTNDNRDEGSYEAI